MHRHALLVALLLPLSACGREAQRQAEESRARAAAVEAELQAARETMEAESAAAKVASASIVSLALLQHDEMLAASAPGVSQEEVARHAERILRLVDEHAEALGSTLDGKRILIEGRLQAARLLAGAGALYADRATALSAQALQEAQAALDAAPEDRGTKGLLGDAYAGAARVERARGDLASASASYRHALDLLIAADKGRGDGTGSSENRGEGSGGGKGRGHGKGKNKLQSLLMKTHTCAIYDELGDVFAAMGNFPQEALTLDEERLVQANICQVQSTSGLTGDYHFARRGMAELIDRLGDATLRKGDAADAVKIEQLSLSILRELSEERPSEMGFVERLVPQEIEIAEGQAALGQLEELRATVVQALEDQKVLRNLGQSEVRLRTEEARLALAMARGLTLNAERGAGGPDLLAEAANWYGRALECVDSLRVDGQLAAEFAPLESEAIAGMEKGG